MSEFGTYENGVGDNYFTTYSQSAFPDSVDVAANEEVSCEIDDTEEDQEPIAESINSDQSASGLLTIRSERSTSGTSIDRLNDDNIVIDSDDDKHSNNWLALKRGKITSSEPKPTKRKKAECPPYKIVKGTKFAVDGFRYGDIEGVEHYFLTHFHADHYIGLTKSFKHKLYLSPMTGLYSQNSIICHAQC